MPDGYSCFKIPSAKSTKKIIGQNAHHLFFTFYQFCNETYLKFSSMIGKYFVKLQRPCAVVIINKNKTIIAPFSDIFDQELSNLRSDMPNYESLAQQENDEFHAEVAVVLNNVLKDHSFTDDAVILDDKSLNMPS